LLLLLLLLFLLLHLVLFHLLVLFLLLSRLRHLLLLHLHYLYLNVDRVAWKTILRRRPPSFLPNVRVGVLVVVVVNFVVVESRMTQSPNWIMRILVDVVPHEFFEMMAMMLMM